MHSHTIEKFIFAKQAKDTHLYKTPRKTVQDNGRQMVQQSIRRQTINT